jgi:PadR family transcriptional regulator AphA
MSLGHVLLALLAQEPASGYRLKARIERDLDPLWTAELSQIYPALAGLWRAGYVSVRVRGPERGPASRRYRLTAGGRRELARWLSEPPLSPSLRDESLTRLLLVRALGGGRAREALSLYERAVADEMARIRGKPPGSPPAAGVRQLSISRLEGLRRWARAALARGRG